MIVVTGAKGFIASNLIESLNNKGFNNLILVDENKKTEKDKNLSKLDYSLFIDRNVFIKWLEKNYNKVDFIFHLGARTDTTEQNINILNTLNLDYSKALFTICIKHKIDIIYASSAATYGNGNVGYSDATKPDKLSPLNPYGESKNNFDKWVLKQSFFPTFWAGLKFFNVFGKHEEHKDRMASVVFQAYNQVKKSGEIILFESHRNDIKHGEQQRDFIYVADVVDVCMYFFNVRKPSGIYNVGTGNAQSFNTLAKAIFKSLQIKENIKYKPTPVDIRNTYQYFTQADTTKLREAGYIKNFTSLTEAIDDYIKNYLDK